MNHPTVRRATRTRWLGVIFYGIFAGALYALVDWPLSAAVRSLGLVHSTGSWLLDCALGLTILLALAFALVKICGFRVAHLKNAGLYPPFLATAFFGTAAFCVTRYQRTDFTFECTAMLGSFAVLLAAVVLSSVVPDVLHPRATGDTKPAGRSYHPSEEGTNPSEMSEGAFRRWLQVEDPISSESDDLFGATRRARRIAKRLQEDPDICIGIVGPFGSGKTSLTMLVEAAIKVAPHRFLFARVSCWGFETAAKAEMEILNSIVRTLEEQVDCLAVHAMPKAYLSRISVGIPWFDSFLAGCCAGGPEEALSALSPILEAVDLHLVVVLDDIDRTSATFDKQQIQALVSRLRQVKGVSVMITASTFTPFTRMTDKSAQDVDMQRLCEYVYDITRIDTKMAREVMGRAHAIALTTGQGDVAAPRFAANQFVWLRVDVFSPLLGISDWLADLSALLSSLRQLKGALRRTISAWDNLHGEAVFEEVLIVNVLRETYPSALDFISSFRVSIASLGLTRSISGDKKPPETFLDALWTKCMGDGLKPEGSLKDTVRRLLPESSVDLEHWRPTGPSSAQSMAFEASTDYWQRVLEEEVPPDELRDQTVLGAIKRWQSGQDITSELPRNLATHDVWGSKWEQFGGALADDDVAEMACQHFVQLRILYRNSAHSDMPGFAALWRMANRRLPPDHALLGKLEKQVELSFPVSLRLVFDIFNFWIRSHYMRFAADDKKAALAALLSNARNCFCRTGGSDALASALPPDFYYTLYHLMRWHEDRPLVSEGLSGPNAWNFMVQPILALLEERPQMMVPHTVVLLHKDRQRNDVDLAVLPYEFDEEFCRAFFGEATGRAMKAMAAEIALGSDVEEQLRADVQRARTLACKYLETLRQA